MPRRASSNKKKSSRRRQSRPNKKMNSFRPFRNMTVVYQTHPADPPMPRSKPHHYEYRSGDIHDHLNRVNHGARNELSQQDEMQRQLKKETMNYKPNYMHVSSSELAIPAPLKRMHQGMRVFTSA